MADSYRNPLYTVVSGTHLVHKRDLFVEQKGECAGCGIALPYKYFEVDHIHPISKGGGDERSNLQMLCRPCNSHKRTRSQSEFMSTVVPIKDQPIFQARTTGNILRLEAALAEAQEELSQNAWTIHHLYEELVDLRHIISADDDVDTYEASIIEDDDAFEQYLSGKQAERNAPFVN